MPWLLGETDGDTVIKTIHVNDDYTFYMGGSSTSNRITSDTVGTKRPVIYSRTRSSSKTLVILPKTGYDFDEVTALKFISTTNYYGLVS